MFKFIGKDNIYDLDLSLFMENQSKIMNKYLYALEDLSLFEKIDKYIMQIVEEIWESKTADNEIEKIKELCDVVMYIGSTYKLIEEHTNIHPIIDFSHIILYKNNNFNIDIIFEKIINIRRLFPERKWHKKESNDIKASNEDINVVLIMLYNMIKEIFEYLIFSNKIIDPFIYIEAKEKKILSNK